MKKIIFIGLALVFIISMGVGAMIMNENKQISKIEINDVPLDTVEDGVYEGSYETNMISAKVEVEVKDNKIEKIVILEHKTGKGKKAEVIVNDIIKQQTIDVDVISGATGSSKVIKKAVEKALSNDK